MELSGGGRVCDVLGPCEENQRDVFRGSGKNGSTCSRRKSEEFLLVPVSTSKLLRARTHHRYVRLSYRPSYLLTHSDLLDSSSSSSSSLEQRVPQTGGPTYCAYTYRKLL